jgi:O-antigen/teichoic acid export membrane protein
MSAASKAVSLRVLGHRALSIGAVAAFDQALQFLLPVVLVRCLDAATFGEYRLLWLALGTVSVMTLNMDAGALYYYLPRSDAQEKRLYVHQTLLYMIVIGVLCGWAASPLNPLLPASLQPLAKYDALVPAFIALWMASWMLDSLPTVEERIPLQAAITLTLSVARALVVALGAWFTGDLRVVFALLCAVVLLKFGALAFYIHRRYGLGGPWFDRRRFAEQFRHVAPFGVSNALFGLRAQADQFVAASLFALSSFAAFSIAGIVAQVTHLFRVSVLNALLPQMSRMHAAGDVRGMIDMNRRGNAMVGTLLYPLLAFAFLFAEDIVTFVYTAAYTEAVPAIRIYIVAMALRVIEVGSVLLLLGLGQFALWVNALALVVSAGVSWFAARHFGLAGAAAGGVAAVYLDRALLLRSISTSSGVPLRELQDWRVLGRSIAVSALVALGAWAAAAVFLGRGTPFARLALAGAVLAALYGAMYLRGRTA